MAALSHPQPDTPSQSPQATASTITAANPSTREKPNSISLWNVPSLVHPSPPSNTLLITNLKSPHIFSASSLQHLYNLLNSPVALNSFAPLPSLRRIIISYPTTEAAIATRQLLEQSASLPTPPATINDGTSENEQQPPPEDSKTTTPTAAAMKIYFGETTPLVGPYATDAPDAHLQAPSLGKLMFISPPPSPPCGWEMREEDPPNKMTHAEDLIAALAGLGGGRGNSEGKENGEDHNDGRIRRKGNGDDDVRNEEDSLRNDDVQSNQTRGRARRGTLTVYHPRDHGDSEDLPAVMVEDMTGDEDATAPEETGPLPTRTSRPPVELMDVSS